MLKSLYRKINFELYILLLTLAELFMYLPTRDGIDAWCYITYLGDYSHGFTSRFLIGEILTRFTDFISVNLIYNLSLTLTIILCVLLAVLGGRVIRKAEGEARIAAEFIIAFMIASPIFIPILSSWLGLTDIWLIVLTLITLILNENKYLRFLIPVLCLACTAIHQSYMFMYMTLTCIVLLDSLFRNRKYLRDSILCFITYVSLIALGLYIQFARQNLDGISSEALAEEMLAKSDLPIASDWLADLLKFEYFLGTADIYYGIGLKYNSILNLSGIIFFLPLLATLAAGWCFAIKNAEKKAEKFTLFLCLIQPLSVIPCYIMATNWNRWTSSIITVQCALYLYFIYKCDVNVSAALGRLVAFFRKHLALPIIYFVFYVSLSKLLR